METTILIFFICIAVLSWIYAIYILMQHRKFKKEFNDYIDEIDSKIPKFEITIGNKKFLINEEVFNLIHNISKERDYYKDELYK